MKYFWINIDTAVSRKIFMEKQFEKLEMENYRISAITPDTIDFSKIIKNKNSNNSPYEYACILSHLKAIKEGYESGDDMFIILEDDMNVEKFHDDKVLTILSKEDNVEMIQIFNSSHYFIVQMYNDFFVKDNKLLIKRDQHDYPGMGCYLLTHNGAKKILDTFVLKDSEYLYDLSMSSWCCADNILYKCTNTYIFTYPFITTCSEFDSHIHNEHIKYHMIANNVISKINEINNAKHLII